jgi:hypothetical protein
MEENAIQRPKKITVLIQGETDWLRFSFDTNKLDLLKNSTQNLGLLGALMGQILDGSKLFELSTNKKQKVQELLARYVANLASYEQMLETGWLTLVITSLRIKDGKRKGYETRVAGILELDFDNISVIFDNIEVPEEPMFFKHIILLYCLSESWSFYTGKYDQKSIWHDLIRQARETDGIIEIRSKADPSIK